MSGQSNASGVPQLRFSVLERPRLQQQLVGGGAAPAAITLICGPMGAGKTVAAVQWARLHEAAAADEATASAEAPAAEAPATAPTVRWVGMDDCPTGAANVWSKLQRAISGVAHTAHADEHAGLRDLEAVVNELTGPMVLVIDDWHRVSSVEVDTALAGLVEHRPQLSLLVLSRRFAALAGSPIAGRMNVQSWSAHDLAFTPDEVAQMIVGERKIGADRAGLVHKVTGGWPLAVQSLARSVSSPEHLRERPLQAAMQAFAADIAHAATVSLSGQARELLQLLALSGGCDTVGLAEIRGGSEAEVLGPLAELEQVGLVCRGARAGYLPVELHPAIAACLRAQVRQEIGDDAVREVQLRAGRVIAAQDPVAGLRLLAEHGDLDVMQEVLASDFALLLEQREHAQGLLNRFEFDALEAYPMLMAARLILAYSDPAVPQATIEAWQVKLRAGVRRYEGERGPSPVLLQAMLCATERMAGNGAEALRLASDLERQFAERSSMSQGNNGRPPTLMHAVLAYTGLASGDLGLADRQYRLTLEHAEQWGDIAEQLRGCNGLAMTAAIMGDMPAVEEWLRRADELERETGVVSPELSWIQKEVSRAFVALEKWQPDVLHDVLARVEPWTTRMELWPVFVVAETALVRLRHGESHALASARVRTVEAKQGFVGTSYTRVLLAAYLANLTMSTGDPSQTANDLALLPEDHPDAAVARVRFKLFREDYLGALAAATDAEALNLTHRLTAELLVLRALAAWRMDDLEPALNWLSESVEWSERYGLTSPFMAVPHDWVSELAVAARDAGKVDIVAMLQAVPLSTQVVLVETLTDAELRTLAAVSREGTLDEVATELFLSRNTVKFHLRSVYRKLRVDGRVDAVVRATRLGIIERSR